MSTIDSRIIALTSQKGGSGKTTIAMQLAAGLALRGYRVVVADLDPQASSTRWIGSAPPTVPFPAELVCPCGSDKDIEQALRPAANRADFVVIDCPPSIEHPHVALALDLCDLAIVPVVPNPTDLWATRATERMILDRRRTRPSLVGALLPNRVMRTALAADVLSVMRDFDLPVLEAALSQRNAFAQAAVLGSSVFALGRLAAAAQEEVEQVVSAVLQQLEE